MAGEGLVKIPFGVKAVKPTDPLVEIEANAIYADKGIPITTPDGTRIFIISIDNDGNLTTTEVTG